MDTIFSHVHKLISTIQTDVHHLDLKIDDGEQCYVNIMSIQRLSMPM